MSFEDFSQFMLNFNEEDYDEENYMQADEANQNAMDEE